MTSWSTLELVSRFNKSNLDVFGNEYEVVIERD